MRIISKYHDYYDCVQAYGQDRSLLYIRKTEEVKLTGFLHRRINDQWPFPSAHPWWTSNFDQYIIGFCGKIYPMLNMHDYNRATKIDIVTKCFNIDEVDVWTDNKIDQKKDYYQSRKHDRKNKINFFNECLKKQDSYFQYFTDKLCPIFVAENLINGQSKIIYNALLKPYDFIRIFDPYTAFQEISMFMGNMAIPEKEMPIISNELKIHSHGFDKFSFRTPPGGK